MTTHRKAAELVILQTCLDRYQACCARSPCVGRLLETVVPGSYGQPTRLPDMIVSDVAVRALHSQHVLRSQYASSDISTSSSRSPGVQTDLQSIS